MIQWEDLAALDDHWAVSALNASDRAGAEAIVKRHLMKAVTSPFGQPVDDFASDDEGLLERVATAYELAAIEGLGELLHPGQADDSKQLRTQCEAAAYQAYELLRVVRIPTDDDARIFHVLHLAALAYCSDRWTEIRRLLKERSDLVSAPSVADQPWEYRVLYRLYECWLRLLRKNGWDDVQQIGEIVAGLRADQSSYEEPRLAEESGSSAQATALRLVGLYNLARATELLAEYLLTGTPAGIRAELDSHFELAQRAAVGTADSTFELLLRWLHVAARRMVTNSLWTVARSMAPAASRLVEHLGKGRSMFEFLPPQRAALQQQGLLDVASRAVVVDLPTSAGKTILAEFRILQALSQFDADQGWVAYVAPTRALVAQLARRLREDFEPVGILVEQLSSAIDLDSFEEDLLSSTDVGFQVLVATPEKLDFVIRNHPSSRPLALVVMDEAHNIEDEERGLRIELLLATIKREVSTASFLLLMPHVPNASELARWLAPEAGRTISLGTAAWQPNERVVGLYNIRPDDHVRAGWVLQFEALTTPRHTIEVPGRVDVGPTRPLDEPLSAVRESLTKQTGAIASIFAERGTSIAVAGTIPNVWSMARSIAENLPPLRHRSDNVRLVQRFLAAEISPDFELVELLESGVGVHHSGLSDEARHLMEWLTEEGELRVLCATTTIAQGINFPVSSVFLATRFFPYGQEMSARTFWNLAGRAGRVDQESIGIVGLAAGKNEDAIKSYVSHATEDLVSRLVKLLNDVQQQGELEQLSLVIQQEQWADFRSYVAHLWRQKGNLEAVLAETEQLLRNTYGYGALQASNEAISQDKARFLLEATRDYATRLAEHPENAILADSTGFAPEGVRNAILSMNQLDRPLTAKDWDPTSLFGKVDSSLAQLVGVMFRVPALNRELEKMGTRGRDHRQIAEIAQAWVTGASIEEIARRFFIDPKRPGDLTRALTEACRDIYGVLANAGTWGLAALSKLPSAGLDFDSLSELERRRLNLLPAMLYHGVSTESGVLMRMNSVPRSVAERLGKMFESEVEDSAGGVRVARSYIRSLTDSDWERATPPDTRLTGSEYRRVWARFAGERIGTPAADSNSGRTGSTHDRDGGS